MTPHKQLFRHDPANGIYGDCDRTSIACLLDLHPLEVPHFCGMGESVGESKAAKQAFLAERGLHLIAVPIWGETPLEVVLGNMKVCNPDVHYLLMGRSKNGCNHVVVCRDDRIVHDPAIDDSGIVGPDIDENHWWVEFLAVKL